MKGEPAEPGMVVVAQGADEGLARLGGAAVALGPGDLFQDPGLECFTLDRVMVDLVRGGVRAVDVCHGAQEAVVLLARWEAVAAVGGDKAGQVAGDKVGGRRRVGPGLAGGCQVWGWGTGTGYWILEIGG